MRLALLLAALLALTPGAAAATARVELVAAESVWNGVSAMDAPLEGSAQLWVPAQARLHGVVARTTEGAQPATWRAVATDRIEVDAPPGAEGVEVAFDVPDARPNLVRYVAPPGVDEVRVVVQPPQGRTALSPQGEFQAQEGGASVLARPVVTGDAIDVRVVAADRVGEIPVAIALAGLSLLALLAGLAWHALRPPLGGRAPTRFLEHLTELQARLLPPMLAFGLLNVLYFTCGLRVMQLAEMPVVVPTFSAESTLAARAFDAIAERLVPAGVQLVVLRPADAVVAQLGICLFLAFVTALPLLVYEIAAFLAPGLEQRERRLAARVLPVVVGLFLAGALVGFLVMAPFMIRTLYAYAPTLGATPLLSVGDLIGFALLVVLTLGLAFELPVVMYALSRLGVVRARTFARYVRHAIVVIVILSGMLTPDPSVISQLLLAGPLVGLYLLGIAAAGVAERRRAPVPAGA